MKANFSIDPMYITVFCIVKWIENYHSDIEEDYSVNVVYVPEQSIDETRFIYTDSKDEAINNTFDKMDVIEYREILNYDLTRDIPNNKAKRFADFEYLSKYKLYLEDYDSDKAMELIQVYADKKNLTVVDFDDYDEIGKIIWEHIHSTKDWRDIYMDMLASGHGDTGMGVYSESMKHFIPCKFAEHKDAIYEMLRMFDEFKEMDDGEFFRLTRFPKPEDKELTDKMDYLVMNDFKLVGNSYQNSKEYL